MHCRYASESCLSDDAGSVPCPAAAQACARHEARVRRGPRRCGGYDACGLTIEHQRDDARTDDADGVASRVRGDEQRDVDIERSKRGELVVEALDLYGTWATPTQQVDMPWNGIFRESVLLQWANRPRRDGASCIAGGQPLTFGNMLRRNAMLANHRSALTIWVDPRHVDHYVGKNIPTWAWAESLTGPLARRLPPGHLLRTAVQWLVQESVPYVIPGDLYATPTAVVDLPKYKAMADLVGHRADYTRSLWYQNMATVIEGGGVAQHKHRAMQTISELNAFFEDYLLVLIDTMKDTGYAYRSSDDVGYVTVGAGGELHKANAGEHRFLAAKILGTARIPVRVSGVHEQWVRSRRRSRVGGSAWMLKAVRELALTDR